MKRLRGEGQRGLGAYSLFPLVAAAGGVSSQRARPLLRGTVNDFTGALPVLNTCLPSTFFILVKATFYLTL